MLMPRHRQKISTQIGLLLACLREILNGLADDIVTISNQKVNCQFILEFFGKEHLETHWKGLMFKAQLQYDQNKVPCGIFAIL